MTQMLRDDFMSASRVRRVLAMILRHLYVIRSSWPRLIELIYWPVLEIVFWGLMTGFFMRTSLDINGAGYVKGAMGILLGGALLWEITVRSQLGMTFSTLEEFWSRNMGHLFVSPLRPFEWVLALMGMSVVRMLISVIPASLIALVLYQYSVFDLGLPLIAFFINLVIMGWWIALLVMGMLMVQGLGAESLAWMAVFTIGPFCAVYFPVADYPVWLQPLVKLMPASHAFEGMRAVMLENRMDWTAFFNGLGLNAVFLVLAGWVFMVCFNHARRKGGLLNIGE